MRINHRPYRNGEDLHQIGRLIRHTHSQAPHSNAWSFARFDIWAQRRAGDEQVHGKRDWQQGVRLWEVATGELAGAVLFANDHCAALVYDPDRRETVGPMLAWAEARYTENGDASKPLTVEATASNSFLEQSLRARGYAKPEAHFIYRQKLLEDDRSEPVPLPDGFYVKYIETLGELRAFHRAVQAVFSFEDSVEVYRILQQAPSYVPELDLILLSTEGEIAAFCTAWLDRESAIAEFEPVGTVPQYRKRGLGSALLADANNRLRSAGCRLATVFSWSESVGANRLYAGAGLEEKDKLYGWQWQG
jgi:GNAT superfamily N-acetyltransferase